VSRLIAWWFQGDGAKETAGRVAMCATLAWVVAPRVPPLIDGLLAILGVSLLLGPVIAVVERVLAWLGDRDRGRQRRSPERRRSVLPSFVVSIIAAALVSGVAIYIAGEEAAQRQLAEERRDFAVEREQLREERRAAVREEQRRNRAINRRLARVRLSKSMVLIAPLVRRARREYVAWEGLLLRNFGPCRETRLIMHQVGHDIRNIDRARDLIRDFADARSVKRDIRAWLVGSVRNRKMVDAGAREYHPVRFLLTA
jgi:hypothetical protein